MSLHTILKSESPVSVSRFMELALTHPEYGYYTKNPSISAEGDFLTAPEISQVFGELIAIFALNTMGTNLPFTLIELGGGNGTLLRDILHSFKKLAPNCLNTIYMVEVSNPLKLKQQAIAEAYGYTLHHVSHFTEIPCTRAFILANEWLDTLPIQQYMQTTNGFRERFIAATENSYTWQIGNAEQTHQIPKSKQHIPVGSIVERCQQAETFINQLAPFIMQQSTALLIDYGYEHPESYGDTLQALKNHHPVDVLSNPGEADITAHVDFAALSKEAQNRNLPHALLTQKDFLQQMGIHARFNQLIQQNPEKTEQIHRQCNRLIDDSQMGTLFKVLCLSHHIPFPFAPAHY
jgi:SAM-dependent MidA family methyltransferase